MAESINWHNEKRRIKDIVPYVANPRQITDKQAKDLKASLAKFGLADPLIINTNNELIGGHQRKKILETLLGVAPDFEIDVRVPDRELSIDEARELNVRLNKNVAEWDFDILANDFDLEDLVDWGFSEKELGFPGDLYTSRIVSPHYEPSENKPDILELYDKAKADRLIAEINASEVLTEDEKQFLILAANRHVVFNFKKIADYYSNSSAEVQRIMENSALVIIDYEKAIEQGFVDFTNAITDLYEEDYAE